VCGALPTTDATVDHPLADDLDDGRRCCHQSDTAVVYHRFAATEPHDCLPMCSYLLGSGFSLEREYSSAFDGEGKTPRSQPVEGSDGAGGDDIGAFEP
jgi:hypothetical protein